MTPSLICQLNLYIGIGHFLPTIVGYILIGGCLLGNKYLLEYVYSRKCTFPNQQKSTDIICRSLEPKIWSHFTIYALCCGQSDFCWVYPWSSWASLDMHGAAWSMMVRSRRRTKTILWHILLCERCGQSLCQRSAGSKTFPPSYCQTTKLDSLSSKLVPIFGTCVALMIL